MLSKLFIWKIEVTNRKTSAFLQITMNVTDLYLHLILRQNFTLYLLLVLSIKDTENNPLSIIYTPFMLYNKSHKFYITVWQEVYI